MEERKQESVKAHPTSISIVEPVPAEIDAGSDMALKIRVLCASGCNLLGGRIRIRDNQGDVVTEADLHSFDGTNNATNVFTVRVPVIPGEYIWSADFLAVEEENILHQESSLTFSFQVKPHQISLSIWGVPSPVSKGEKFKINIGAKCSSYPVSCRKIGGRNLTPDKWNLLDRGGT
jgi:hypothetical protein